MRLSCASCWQAHKKRVHTECTEVTGGREMNDWDLDETRSAEEKFWMLTRIARSYFLYFVFSFSVISVPSV